MHPRRIFQLHTEEKRRQNRGHHQRSRRSEGLHDGGQVLQNAHRDQTHQHRATGDSFSTGSLRHSQQGVRIECLERHELREARAVLEQQANEVEQGAPATGQAKREE